MPAVTQVRKPTATPNTTFSLDKVEVYCLVRSGNDGTVHNYLAYYIAGEWRTDIKGEAFLDSLRGVQKELVPSLNALREKALGLSTDNAAAPSEDSVSILGDENNTP